MLVAIFDRISEAQKYNPMHIYPLDDLYEHGKRMKLVDENGHKYEDLSSSEDKVH